MAKSFQTSLGFRQDTRRNEGRSLRGGGGGVAFTQKKGGMLIPCAVTNAKIYSFGPSFCL